MGTVKAGTILVGTPGLSVGTRLTGRAPDTQLTTASCLDSNPPGHPFSPRLRGVQDQPRLTAWPRGRGLPREAPSPPGSCALQGEGGLEPAGQLIPAAAVRRGEGGRNNAPTRTAPAPKCPAVTHAGQAPRQTPRNFSGSGGTGRGGGGGGGGRACVIYRRGAGRGAWGRPAGAAPPRGRSAAAQEGGSCSAACHRSESPWRGGRGWKSPLRWGFFLCLVK